MNKTHTGLCFTKNGIINAHAVNYAARHHTVEHLVFFGDGTSDALDHIADFSQSDIITSHRVKSFVVARTPLYSIRLTKPDGQLSKPQYMWDEPTKIKWICSKVAAPLLDIYLSDVSSTSLTQVKLDTAKKEAMCYAAHHLWNIMLIAQDMLGFPAAVIDLMTRYTAHLTPDTIDILQLRLNTGLSSINYHSPTDTVSVEVKGETFAVKLSVLNTIYGNLILPVFNRLYGRRYRMTVAVTSANGHLSEPVDMTFGELGRIIEEMRASVKEEVINEANPILGDDLTLFASKIHLFVKTRRGDANQRVLERNDTHFIWVPENKTVAQIIAENRDSLLYREPTSDD